MKKRYKLETNYHLHASMCYYNNDDDLITGQVAYLCVTDIKNDQT